MATELTHFFSTVMMSARNHTSKFENVQDQRNANRSLTNTSREKVDKTVDVEHVRAYGQVPSNKGCFPAQKLFRSVIKKRSFRHDAQLLQDWLKDV